MLSTASCPVAMRVIDSACSVVRGKDHVIQAVEHFSNMGFILEHVQGGPGDRFIL